MFKFQFTDLWPPYISVQLGVAESVRYRTFCYIAQLVFIYTGHFLFKFQTSQRIKLQIISP